MASPVAVSCQVGVMFSHGNDGENYDENDGKMRNSYFFKKMAEIIISLGVIIRNN